MGATSSPLPVLPESKHYTIIDYGYCKVWKRNDTHRQTMEQYSVSIDNQEELGKYRHMWQFRMKQDQAVSVYYFTHEQTKELCGLFQKGTMLTERIPYRLKDFKNIPYEEVLTIIKEALSGYKQLYKEYGLFVVRATMLGINHKNKLKIWHHPDFSRPLPQNSNCKNILDMLASIIYTIQKHADEPEDYVRFSDFIRANKDRITPDFDELLEVLQTYKKMNHIVDHEKLPKLEYYLNRAQGWQDDSFYNLFSSNQAQVNKSSRPFPSNNADDFDNQSVNSVKTIKNNPFMNIYTTKDVSQIMEREKYLNRNLQIGPTERSRQRQYNLSPKAEQKSLAFKSPVHRLMRSDREPINFAPRQPLIKRQSPCVKLVARSPSEHHKIQFKIIPTITNNHKKICQIAQTRSLSIQNLKPSNSSIQKRLTFQPEQRPSIYTLPHQVSHQRSKIDQIIQNKNVYPEPRRPSMNIAQSPRAQY